VSGAPTDGSVFIQFFDPSPAVRFAGPGTMITADPQDCTYALS
jgi:hypothetical protein